MEDQREKEILGKLLKEGQRIKEHCWSEDTQDIAERFLEIIKQNLKEKWKTKEK